MLKYEGFADKLFDWAIIKEDPIVPLMLRLSGIELGLYLYYPIPLILSFGSKRDRNLGGNRSKGTEYLMVHEFCRYFTT
jgi:hypothetical protein